MVASGVVTASSVVPVRSVERAAEGPTIAVVERSPAADRKSETITATTRDLPEALTNLTRLCAERDRGGPVR